MERISKLPEDLKRVAHVKSDEHSRLMNYKWRDVLYDGHIIAGFDEEYVYLIDNYGEPYRQTYTEFLDSLAD